MNRGADVARALRRGLLAAAVVIAGLMSGGISAPAQAIEPLSFDDPARQQRYEALLGELRCLVCQNESLASSEAGLAADLRREVHARVAAGESDAEIRQYLVDRYGEFVLYRPRLSWRTGLLWFAPALLLVFGLLLILRIVRRRGQADVDNLSADDRARLDAVLQQHGHEQGRQSGHQQDKR